MPITSLTNFMEPQTASTVLERSSAEVEISYGSVSRCCLEKWDMISGMTWAGYTADVAIDKIYKAYGESISVTKILLDMIEDQKNGGHPQLRI